MGIIVLVIIIVLVCIAIKKSLGTSGSADYVSHTVSENDYSLELLTETEKSLLSSKGGNRLERAVQLHQKAISGDTSAMVMLGAVYSNDLDKPEKAYFWFEKASRMGDLEGLYWQGACCKAGYGTEQNELFGLGLIMQAAKAGEITALNDLKDRGYPPEAMRKYGVPEEYIKKVY